MRIAIIMSHALPIKTVSGQSRPIPPAPIAVRPRAMHGSMLAPKRPVQQGHLGKYRGRNKGVGGSNGAA